ncbi:MAG: hypothetical protein EXR71_14460 [Myxococcales bacterium]|nr:hypothetical protein [Myxococcales bacterium]
MLLLLWTCAADADPCTAMCAAAGTLYGGCLTSWGTSWEAANYADEADFLDACATWAWEMRQLEVEAGEVGATDQMCMDRSAAFEGDDATCDTYTTLDWNTPSWEAGP